MSLADQIVKRNEEASDASPSTDELGLTPPSPETPQYLVARALLLDTRAHEGEPRIHCLHLRDDQVYAGHMALKESEQAVYELTHLNHSLKKFEVVAFWRELRKYLPKLDRTKLEIAEGLLWDIESGKMVPTKERG